VLEPAADTRPEVLVKDSLVFMPSAAPDRVWVGIGADTASITALREVSVDGRITVPDTKPPVPLWPAAALDVGLAFELPGGHLEVWNPLSGELVRRLPGAYSVASHGNVLSWCGGGDCRTLHVTDVMTGKDVKVSPPPGTSGFDRAMFSPSGENIAVAVHTGPLLEGLTTLKSQLALVDVRTGTARIVEGTALKGAHVFVDWSPSGDAVFIAGGNQLADRTIIEYRLGADRARRLNVKVGEFSGMAAA
jgi:hypothetical protein